MSLDQVRSYFGFTKVPFGKSLPPSALYRPPPTKKLWPGWPSWSPSRPSGC